MPLPGRPGGCRARLAVTADPALYGELKSMLAGTGTECAAGPAAVIEAAERPADMVMAAIVGADGLAPTLAAARQGATIALANKECLVSRRRGLHPGRQGGGRRHPAGRQRAQRRFPVPRAGESRPSRAHHPHRLGRAVPHPLARTSLPRVTPADALKHPNWSMGRKVTIDSATLMNKGLELIEAFHLFPVALDQLAVVIHPQSIVHSFVSYRDGSVIAQLGVPDMRTPIAYALAWPRRIAAPVAALDLARIGTLTFETVDAERFPSVDLARHALRSGGSASTILNAANEVAVAAFLAGELAFLAITELVGRTLGARRARRDGGAAVDAGRCLGGRPLWPPARQGAGAAIACPMIALARRDDEVKPEVR